MLKRWAYAAMVAAVLLAGIGWRVQVVHDESCKQSALYWAELERDMFGHDPNQQEIEAKRELC